MTRFKILFLAALLSCVSLNARLRYGISLGGNFDSYRTGNTSGIDIRNGSGFSGGLLLDYQIKSTGLTTTVGVLYSRHHVDMATSQQLRTELPVNHIDIPLHINYNIPLKALAGMVTPMIYTGPDFQFAMGSRVTALGLKRFQPGWDVGIGINVINFIRITGGYTFGLKSIAPQDIAGTLRTGGWNIAVNLLFDF